MTAKELVAYINQLPKYKHYSYLNPRNKGNILLVRVELPSGPIWIKRWNKEKNESPYAKEAISISVQMIQRVAKAITEGIPFNIDKILGASYNTRSVLETLLAHTSNFYYCYPGRVEWSDGCSVVRPGHKHLIYLPDSPHKDGILMKWDTNMVISKLPPLEIHYNIHFPKELLLSESVDYNSLLRKNQILYALYRIAAQIGNKVVIQKGALEILVDGVQFKNLPNIIELGEIEAINKIVEQKETHIGTDCMWINPAGNISAILEVFQVKPLSVCLNNLEKINQILREPDIKYILVLPDDSKELVIEYICKKKNWNLDIYFMLFSDCEELLALILKRDAFMISKSLFNSYLFTI